MTAGAAGLGDGGFLVALAAVLRFLLLLSFLLAFSLGWQLQNMKKSMKFMQVIPNINCYGFYLKILLYLEYKYLKLEPRMSPTFVM